MADVSLNASMVLESHFYRNMGVAFSQLVRLEPTAERRAAHLCWAAVGLRCAMMGLEHGSRVSESSPNH